jgi:3-methyladenine DNA glycosylase AlkD
MRAAEAQELGRTIGEILHRSGSAAAAMKLLRPVLAQRVRFPILERIGEAMMAQEPQPDALRSLLAAIAATRAIGGWVIIAIALRQDLSHNAAGALAQARDFIAQADVWYGTDIIGERVIGTALLTDFKRSLKLLGDWRHDPNRWIRRAIGAGIHHWAKRSRASSSQARQAGEILHFLEPVLQEQDVDAIKGIGWAIKTLGRFHPDLVARWLVENGKRPGAKIKALMLRKATTYMNRKQRAQVRGAVR